MRNRSLGLLLLWVAVTGCGKSETASDNVLVDVGPPSASVSGDRADLAAPPSPPGTIELPAGFDPSAVTSQPPSTETKSGGFEMPPIDSAAAPVVARRPLLDEPAAASEIKLTAEPLAKTLERAAKAGQVTVVDIWSLSCEPCLKEFPGLVQLNQELAGKVTCLSVNVDYDGRKTKPAETYRPRVQAFLTSTGATFENYLCETPSDEVFSALQVASIPAVLVYDKDGQRVRTFTDSGDDIGFSYADDIAPLVRSLVTPAP